MHGPTVPAVGPRVPGALWRLGVRLALPAAARGLLRALFRLLLARTLLAPSPEQEEHAEHDADEQEAPEDRNALVDPAERQRDELDDPPAERQQRDDQEDDQQDPADPEEDARARRGRDDAHEPQRQQLAVGRRGLAELL